MPFIFAVVSYRFVSLHCLFVACVCTFIVFLWAAAGLAGHMGSLDTWCIATRCRDQGQGFETWATPATSMPACRLFYDISSLFFSLSSSLVRHFSSHTDAEQLAALANEVKLYNSQIGVPYLSCIFLLFVGHQGLLSLDGFMGDLQRKCWVLAMLKPESLLLPRPEEKNEGNRAEKGT